MKQESQQPISRPLATVTQQQPYRVFNFIFASKRTFVQFMITSFLIIVIPVMSVLILNNKVKDDPNLSQLMKVVIAVGPALIFINIVMCAYVMRAMKDPLNYQVDPPQSQRFKIKQN